jgi:hypothetical protein
MEFGVANAMNVVSVDFAQIPVSDIYAFVCPAYG